MSNMTIGDDAEYIRDGTGVYHPCADKKAREDIKELEVDTDSRLNDIDAALETKAEAVHRHKIGDVENLNEGLEKKVDKETGKGLSTNDFTDDLKTKLDTSPNIYSIAYDGPARVNFNAGIPLTVEDYKGQTGDIVIVSFPDDVYNSGLNSGQIWVSVNNQHYEVYGINQGNVYLTQIKAGTTFVFAVTGGGYLQLLNIAQLADSKTDGLLSKEDKVKIGNIESGATKNNCSIGIFQNINLDERISSDGTISLTTATKNYEGLPFRDLSEGLIYLKFYSMATTKVSDNTELTLNIDGVSYDFDYIDELNGGRMTYRMLKERYSGAGGFVLFSYDNFYSLPKGAESITVDSALSLTSENPVKNKVIKGELDKKAEKSHSHALTDSTITGTLPVTKGGTGGTTKEAARSALGLGTAATYSASGTVTAGSAALVTGRAVDDYFKAQKINNRTHIVIATYDTKNPLKANADYTCTASDASTVIKKALSEIREGGRIEFLDGTYQLQYLYREGEITIDKQGITLTGAGYSTNIIQPKDAYESETQHAFIINADNVRIKDMMICDAGAEVTLPVSIILQKKEGAIYENVFFIYNADEPGCGNACIEGQDSCRFTRIQNCRIFKGFAGEEKYMFDFSKCTQFSGNISGNILSSGNGKISIQLKDESAKNNTAIYGHASERVDVWQS